MSQESREFLTHTKPVIEAKDLLSFGSTLLNCACSGRPVGGIPKGSYVLQIGDSGSAKTWLAMSILAEAAMNEEFEDYLLIYDNAENGALMDIEKHFGSKLAERLEPPSGSQEEPEYSTLVEDFYYKLDDLFAREKPFIYILDSNDALSSKEDEEKHQEKKAAAAENKDTTGSYGTGKAKVHSNNLRRVCARLRDLKCILIIIGQTRDKIGFGSQFDPKTRSGGKALKFYAHLELWNAITGQIKKKVNGKDRQIGKYIQIKVKKNRVTGFEPTIEIPVYHAFGIDDVGSCIDFLVDEKHWSYNKGTVKAPEFDFQGRLEELIKKIEMEEEEQEVRMLVGKVWKEIQKASTIKRKARYE
jgi:RecA/RadA recombinase